MILKDLALRFLKYLYKLSGDFPYELSLHFVLVLGMQFALFWLPFWSLGPWVVKKEQTVMKSRCGSWHQKK